uniref:Cyclic nucleotide-binding domain-containing protein n=1 Tax=Strigamia maritima TaxID=126957 RepID=T1JLX7_STRMM
MMKRVANTLAGRRPFSVGDSGGGKVVKYTPCSRQDTRMMDEDLDDVAVVSNADPSAVKYGSGSTLTANGPRLVPGIITSCDRTRLLQQLQPQQLLSASGTRINASSPSPVYLGKSSETVRGKSVSRQSLLDVMPNKLTVGGGGGSSGGVGSNGTNGTGGRDRDLGTKESAAYENRGHVGSDVDINRRNQKLPPPWKNGKDELGAELTKASDKGEASSLSSSDRVGCNLSFVFDPSGRLCYYWNVVVSIAFLYNFWAIVYRFSFQEIDKDTLLPWFCLDYFADLLYILDIVFHFRTGYLEDGVLQTDPVRLRQHYLNSTTFYIDCLCLLPLDFLYLSIGFRSFLRCFRLVKIYRFWAFLDRTERHTNYPNVFRACSLIHYLLVIFHWNACLYNLISKNGGFGSWTYPEEEYRKGVTDVVRRYLHSFYWSTLSLTTIGDLPRPKTKGEYLFVIMENVFGLLLFATVLGHVALIVTNVSTARKEFQAKLDGVKTYMRTRRVPAHIQVKVIKWFDYLWMTQKSSDEEKSVGCLPDKLKAEIAIHVHLDTLRRVEIFQNTEAGFLCELVLRLKPVLFSPGDYICRKGEVGKEMYIVNRGRLQVVADNGKTVLATLKAGSYFGEISILNMGTAGNRRTASVRSVGYSDLFCLSKQDMWDVLKEYPAARVRLEAIAVKRLEKYRKAPLEKMSGRSLRPALSKKQPLFLATGAAKLTDDNATVIFEVGVCTALHCTPLHCTALHCTALHCTALHCIALQVAMGRSLSTPGLVESKGRVPLEDMALASPDENSLAYGRDSPVASTSGASSAEGEAAARRAGLYIGSSVLPQPRLGQRTDLLSGGSGGGVHLLLSPGGMSASVEVSPATECTGLSPASTSEHALLSVPTTTMTPSPGDRSLHQELVAEIKRLRERLVTLETENATMSYKLSQQQWEVEHRLAEIEMHICGGGGADSAASADDNNERNRESII